MPPKAKPARARVKRKTAARPLSVQSRKKVANHSGFHFSRYALLAGLAAAAAASALAFLPESMTGDVKKELSKKGKAARASVADAEKMMKQAIEAARHYASSAMH
jgi:hypothetical protein